MTEFMLRETCAIAGAVLLVSLIILAVEAHESTPPPGQAPCVAPRASERPQC